MVFSLGLAAASAPLAGCSGTWGVPSFTVLAALWLQTVCLLRLCRASGCPLCNSRLRCYAAVQRKALSHLSPYALPKPYPPFTRARVREVFLGMPLRSSAGGAIILDRGGGCAAIKKKCPILAAVWLVWGSCYVCVSGALPLSDSFLLAFFAFLFLALSALACSRSV